ncbi:MAG: hypothetical protein KKA79_01830 [Nanoarchaeota archaeon]|nr:hypothetical protein [Nanoarchaeota archaeon]MCG2719031.1 hypothetical protein [Nanoarchaeota archaeon]
MKKKGLTKKVLILTAAMAIGASTPAFAEDEDEIYVKNNGNGLIQVAINKDAVSSFVNDTFFHYKLEWDGNKDDKKLWHEFAVINKKIGYKRELLGYVPKELVPLYAPGIISMYFDNHKGEENLVSVWEDDVDEKIQEQWIQEAKWLVKDLNSGKRIWMKQLYQEEPGEKK